jgi:LysM repeat protein
MTRQQATALIVLNAAVSALISLMVVVAALYLYAPPIIQQVIVEGTIRPAGTPVPTRRTTAVSYTIKSGDSLSAIAANFGITTAALMQANGITNPNLVNIGQVIIIPPPDAAASASPTAPAVTAVPPIAPILKITTILRSSSGTSAGETVIIQNVGARINMKGWTLQDLHNIMYVFPDFVLETSGVVRVHTDSGLDSATDLYWSRPNAVWDSNDTATLKDRSGIVIDSYTIRK